MAEHLSFRNFFMVIVWAPLIESEPQVTETIRHQLPPFSINTFRDYLFFSCGVRPQQPGQLIPRWFRWVACLRIPAVREEEGEDLLACRWLQSLSFTYRNDKSMMSIQAC